MKSKEKSQDLIKLAIVDDDPSYRTSLKNILENEEGIMLYREYESGRDFLRDIHSPFQPDVCLIDIVLGDISGIECAKQIKKKHPDIQIILLTAYPDLDTLAEAREIGADYIEKSSRAEILIKKIILSLQKQNGKHFISLDKDKLTSKSLKLIFQLEEAKKRLSKLSKNQIDILELKKSGKTVVEIAKLLGVHQGTVARQLSRAYEKLQLPDLLNYIDD